MHNTHPTSYPAASPNPKVTYDDPKLQIILPAYYCKHPDVEYPIFPGGLYCPNTLNRQQKNKPRPLSMFTVFTLLPYPCLPCTGFTQKQALRMPIFCSIQYHKFSCWTHCKENHHNSPGGRNRCHPLL